MPLSERLNVQRKYEYYLADLVKELDAEVVDDWIGQMEMQLLYYLKMSRAELDAMSPEEWVRAWCHLKHVRQQEAKEKPQAQ